MGWWTTNACRTTPTTMDVQRHMPRRAAVPSTHFRRIGTKPRRQKPSTPRCIDTILAGGRLRPRSVDGDIRKRGRRACTTMSLATVDGRRTVALDLTHADAYGRLARTFRRIRGRVPTYRRVQLACTGADGCYSDVIDMRTTHISGDTSHWSLPLPVSRLVLAIALHTSLHRSHACFRTRLGVHGQCGRAGSRPCSTQCTVAFVSEFFLLRIDRRFSRHVREGISEGTFFIRSIGSSFPFRLGNVSFSCPRIECRRVEWTRTSSSNHCSANRRHLAPPCMGRGRGHGTSQGGCGVGNEA